MSKLLDLSHLIGKKYNYLTIISDSGVINLRHIIKAKCDCGNIKSFQVHKVLSGHTQSCGCYNKKRAIEKATIHGLSKHPLFTVWYNMKERCYNYKDEAYKNYGGRGIIVCDEWNKHFKSFYDWCIANDWKKGLELDREKNDGNYEPSNCRFVTHAINNRNKRTNRFLVFNNETKTLTEWSHIMNIPVSTIRHRINKRGWSVERTLNTLPDKRFGRHKTAQA